jgi:hypothetical protein
MKAYGSLIVNTNLIGKKRDGWTELGARFRVDGVILVVARCDECQSVSVKVANRKWGAMCRSCSSSVHGGYGSPENNSWSSMRSRCQNPRSGQYHRYGGRGIKVCDRWNDFATFLSDMGPRPSKMHSIDRIDVNGDYCPENCRWATPRQQSGNRRSNRLVSFNGEQKTVAEWAREFGLSPLTLIARLNRGWTTEESLLRPPQKRRVSSHA